MSGRSRRALPIAELLLERQLVASRAEGERLILAGKVRVDGQMVDKAGTRVDPAALIAVEGGLGFVSRGALKLGAALRSFRLDVRGRRCVDVGASTGGFTEVLLRAGAARVYALDSAYGVLDWRLRSDPRVVVMDRCRVMDVTSLPEAVTFATLDVSLLPLRKILPTVLGWLTPSAEFIALIKPQYESEAAALPAGAIIGDADTHRQILRAVLDEVRSQGCEPRGLIASPILGMSGNREFLLWATRGHPPTASFDTTREIEESINTPGLPEEELARSLTQWLTQPS